MKEAGSNKIGAIHMLRGVASVLVVIHHLCFLYWHENNLLVRAFTFLQPQTHTDHLFYFTIIELFDNVSFRLGPFGVGLFFMISGFVIPISLKNAKAGSFLVERIFRIYPTYIFGFSLTLLVIHLYSSSYDTIFTYSLKDHILQIALIRDWFWLKSLDGVSWTLETELKFYLLIWVIWLAGHLNKSRTLTLLALTFCATNIFLYSNREFLLQNNIRLYQITYIIAYSIPWLIFMFLGVCFYNHHSGFWSLREFLLTTQTIFMFFIVAVLFGPGQTLVTIFIVNYTMALLVFAAVYLGRNSIKPGRVLNFLANISYPLYIVHGVNGYILMAFLHDSHGLNAYLCMAIAFTVIIIAASILHFLIERPTNHLGKKIARSIFKEAKEMKSL